MKNTKAPSSRNQVLAPVIIVVIGVAIVGAIAYFGRAAKKPEPTASAGAPGSTRTGGRQNDPNRADRPNRPGREVAKAAPPDVVYDLKDDSVKGDKNAPVVLIEFSDYQ
jgi:hypothetical protein